MTGAHSEEVAVRRSAVTLEIAVPINLSMLLCLSAKVLEDVAQWKRLCQADLEAWNADSKMKLRVAGLDKVPRPVHLA